MPNQRIALLTSTLGLLLCAAQTTKSHIDAEHERARMQEMHEQKMHYLHEFHRREIRERDRRVGVLEEERRLVGRKWRGEEDGRGGVWVRVGLGRGEDDGGGAGEVGDGDEMDDGGGGGGDSGDGECEIAKDCGEQGREESGKTGGG